MKFSAVRRRAAVLGLAAICGACNWQSHDQVSLSQYTDHTNAVQSGAVAKGWVPEFLPVTATNILEWHNIETDRTRVEFSFDTTVDSDWITNLFTSITNARAKSLRRELMLSRGAAINARGTLHFYELTNNPSEQAYLAIDYQKGRAQYWSRTK